MKPPLDPLWLQQQTPRKAPIGPPTQARDKRTISGTLMDESSKEAEETLSTAYVRNVTILIAPK